MSQVLTQPKLLTNQPDIIIQGCRENNLQSQEQLYRLCYPDMIKICYRYAGDMDGAGTIFNNAMLRVFRHIGNYKDEGKFMGWVKTIVINCCLDFVKQSGKIKELPVNTIHEEITVPDDFFDKVSVKEILVIIKELPKATAAVFKLYVYEGFTHKQIGEGLGISEGTSKWHVNEGRRLLKTRLENLLNHKVKKNAAG